MKTQAVLIAVASLAAGACSLAQSPPVDRGPTALTLIVDTSWSCDRFEGDFRTLGRQAISVLQPGDYLEIAAAKPSRCTIALAHTVKKADAAEVKALCDALSRIEAGFLSDADVAIALETTVTRLTELCAKKQIARVATIVLSDGQVNSTQARRILTVADRYQERGWSLYMVGTRDTSKDILLGANRGRLTCSLINEANPGLWLARTEATPTPPPEDGGQTEQQPPEQLTSSFRSGSKEIHDKPQDSSPAQGRVEMSGYNISTRIDTVVGPFPRASDTATSSASGGGGPATTPTEKGGSVAPSVPEDVNRPPDIAKSGEDDMKEADSEPKQPFWARVGRLFGHIWPWLVGGICAVPVTVIGYMFARDSRRAGQIRQRLQSCLKKKRSGDDDVLEAEINGQTRKLGRLSRLRPLYVGSGVKNLLRITEKGISDRHLRLYQKAGRLMLQNLHTKPITIGGLSVERKAKRAVVLPSTIELAENVRLHLFTRGPDNQIAGERSVNHGQTRE